MKVALQLKATNSPIVYPTAQAAYQKLDMYCVVFMDNGVRTVHKYPLNDVFRSVEDYGNSTHGE